MASVATMPLRTVAKAVGLLVPNARKIYEASTPTTQCNNIIDKFKPGTECYICGMKIYGKPKNTSDDTKTGGGRSSRKRLSQSRVVRGIKTPSRAKSASATGKPARGKSPKGKSAKAKSAKAKSKRGGQRNGKDPECEHILPIAQAVMLLGLYGETTKTHFLYNKELVKIEYRWAHRTCNQVKSDDSYLSYYAKRNIGLQYEINKQGLKTLLGNIWNNKRTDSSEFNVILHGAYEDKEAFIASRMKDDSSLMEAFEPIVEFLNRYDAPRVIPLIAAMQALEGPRSKKVSEYMSEEEREKIKTEEQVEREKEKAIEYNSYVNDVMVELKKTFKNEDYTIQYKRFRAKANLSRNFFVFLFFNLSEELQETWDEYVKTKMKALFLEACDEVLIAHKLTTDESPILKSRQLSNLRERLKREVRKQDYLKIQIEENNLFKNKELENIAALALLELESGTRERAERERAVLEREALESAALENAARAALNLRSDSIITLSDSLSYKNVYNNNSSNNNNNNSSHSPKAKRTRRNGSIHEEGKSHHKKSGSSNANRFNGISKVGQKRGRTSTRKNARSH